MALHLLLTALFASAALGLDIDCNAPPTRVPKTVSFAPYYLTGGPVAPARPVTSPIPLIAPNSGVGYVYTPRDTNSSPQSWSMPLLLPNENRWEMVNCTYSGGACRATELALHLPAGSPGTIGALAPITYPKRSPWAVYDLKKVRVIPDAAVRAGAKLVVTVDAWNDRGRKIGRHTQRLRGGAAGYTIALPSTWQRVLKWSLTLTINGASAGYYLDDVSIIDHVYPDTCPQPDVSFGPAPIANTTFEFNDVSIGDTLPADYHGLAFSAAFRVGPLPVGRPPHPNGPGARQNLAVKAAVTGARPVVSGAAFALWDLYAFRIVPDFAAIPANASFDPAHYFAVVIGSGVCQFGSRAVERRVALTTLLGETVDVKAAGENGHWSNGRFERAREVEFSLRYYPDPEGFEWEEVGFWVDDVVARVWKIGEGRGWRQGCERCLKYLGSRCAYPAFSTVEEEE
ncbi:hypothetical protein EDC01DRAFT_786211 [Geopyxis carbonaria]|nr:hypothetical protein EDC01DRAFT_786211 [Geopyxis carbonaria]